MSLVLDSSAAVDLVVGRPELTVLLVGQDLHVPMHFDVEALSAVRGLLLRDQLEAEEAERARSALGQLVTIRHSAQILLDRAWELGGSITIQDGVYVALAESLDCPLLTTDERLGRACSHLVDIVGPGRP